ncbi:MAG TPA: YegS/Rv2252/BmrU family lipid kinase [Tepidisphaeraceae bacterium]|nr:YegS/Rv2252/BmrU family lipid kinase [Tepidisphaeraceae bacterium]
MEIDANRKVARVMIFANRIAGRGRGERMAHALEKRLGAEGFATDIFLDRASDVPADRLTAPAEAAIVIGGDGTLRAAVERLLKADVLPPLLPVPLGTANMMAKYLGIHFHDGDLEGRVSAALARRQILPLDAGRANGRLFLQVAGVGFDAQLIYHLDRLRRGPITFWSYMIPAFLSLVEYDPAPITVRLDGRELVNNECGMVFVGNLRQYGAGFPVLVHARPDDGLLDVCIVKCKSRSGLIRMFLTAAAGEHIHDEDVIYLKGKHVEIDSPVKAPLQIDGDPAGHTPVRIDLLPVRLPFIVP